MKKKLSQILAIQSILLVSHIDAMDTLFKAIHDQIDADVESVFSMDNPSRELVRSTIDQLSDKHETALFMATLREYEKAVKLLLRNGANPNLATDSLHSRGEGVTPLYIAAKRDDVEIARLLLLRGAAINNIACGVTALYVSARKGHAAMFHYLLARGANPSCIVNRNGETILHRAVENGCDTAFCWLYQHGGNIDAIAANNFTPFSALFWGGDIELIKKVLSACPELKDRLIFPHNGLTPLRYVAYLGHDKVVEHLLELNADAHIPRISLLNYLIEYDFKRDFSDNNQLYEREDCVADVVERLMRHVQVDQNASMANALFDSAFRHNKYMIVRLLLDIAPVSHQSFVNALMNACKGRQTAMIMTLLEMRSFPVIYGASSACTSGGEFCDELYRKGDEADERFYRERNQDLIGLMGLLQSDVFDLPYNNEEDEDE